MKTNLRLSRLALTGFILLLAALTVGSIALLNAFVGRDSGTQPPASAHAAIQAAWQQARESGSYRFDGDITQLTLPNVSVVNVGRSSRTEVLHIEGQSDLKTNALELQIWNRGGSVLVPSSGVGIKVANGKTYTRQGSQDQDWKLDEALSMDGIAPQGDFMAYLNAMRDVQAQAPEVRGGIHFTRYTFAVDGPLFADYMREQLESAMRAKGELPTGMHLDTPRDYANLTGTGEFWVRDDGLPLRQIMQLQFPERNGESMQTAITINFLEFAPLSVGWAASFNRLMDGPLADLPAALPYALFTLTLIGVFLRFHHLRRVQKVMTVTLISAIVCGPLMNAFKMQSFLNAQIARAETLADQTAAARQNRALFSEVQLSPHQSPLAAAAQRQAASAQAVGAQVAGVALAQLPAAHMNAPVQQASADSDADGLTDAQEAAIGTDPTFADSDEDQVPDGVEAKGFQLGGKTWYMNANKIDSNDDGILDGLECWRTPPAQSTPTAPVCDLDTDADGTPDVFDDDNDGDGVSDRIDQAPFSAGAATYTEAAPLSLKLNNLAAGKTTFVNFQLRPKNTKQLWYAFNVLDWPLDNAGQLQDVDDKTFADSFAPTPANPSAPANDRNGDAKLIPMLEIRISPTTTNDLNLPPQSDLTPYNISVSNYDTATKVVYVPLTVQTDEKSGQRVAFTARMPYSATGTWVTPHNVRLAWTLQMLNDIPCDPKATNAAQVGCTALADSPEVGYIYNSPQIVQTYYSDWTLTGMDVTEDNGAGIATIYEDPAVDTNLKDETALWQLSNGLDNSFMGGRDADRNAQRDVTLSEITRRFDRDGNGSVSVTERWAIPNILQVEQRNYETLDKAVVATTMTETKRILEGTFAAKWQADKSIKPLLMFASESKYRRLGLDGSKQSGNYVAITGNAVTLDFAPAGTGALAVDTEAGLKWSPYCGGSAATPVWDACETNVYWNELSQRYPATQGLPGEPTDATIGAANVFLTQIYAENLRAGAQAVVQTGARVISSRYSLKTDTSLESSVRTGLSLGTTAIKALAGEVLTARWVAKIPFKQYLGNLLKNLSTKAPIEAIKTINLGTANRLQGSAVIVGGILLVGAMVTAGIAANFPQLFPDPKAAQLGGEIVVNTTIIAISAYFSIISPILKAKELIANGLSTAKALTSSIPKSGQVAGAIGAVIAVTVTWGFFIYGMVSNKVAAFSPDFNKALAETIAVTIFTIVSAVIAATVIGSIIMGIVSIIDAIFSAACAIDQNINGKTALRLEGKFYGGACFTLSTSITKVIAYFLYNYDLMVDTSRADFVQPNDVQTQLANPQRGFVPSNPVTLTFASVSNTVAFKDPDPASGLYIYPYLWLFSEGNLRLSTMRQSLTRAESPISLELNQMPNEWATPVEDHKLLATSMVRTTVKQTIAPVTNITMTAGLNRPAEFYLNLGYALPAYECVGIPNIVPVWTPPVIPICYVRSFTGTNSTKMDGYKFDIFPDTLDALMSLSPKADGGFGPAWDAQFGSIKDADGDGLLNSAFGGLDPNDTTADADNDGLSDTYELQRRQSGAAYSPISCDTDRDGLTDLQESQFGTDPNSADADNDGLADGQEVWHQTYDATCKPTGVWAGGWDIAIGSATPLTIHVSSNPASADSDNDGVNDLAEFQLRGQTDGITGLPFNPNVVNKPPLIVLTEVNNNNRFVARGQSLLYTTTVIANQPMAPSVLDVTAPTQLGGSLAPMTLPFNPATFSNTQMSAQSVLLKVPLGAATTLNLPITSTVRARLAPISGNAYAFDPIVTEAPLGGFAAPFATQFKTGLAPVRPDRQDSYRAAQTIVDNNVKGDIRSYELPAGSSRVLDSDNNTTALRTGWANMASNNAGVSLAVWGEIRVTTTVTTPDSDVISGVLLSSAGIVIKPLQVGRAAVPNVAGDKLYTGNPVVASNGSGFLVVAGAYNIGKPSGTYVDVKGFDANGNATCSIGMQATSTNQLIDLDIAWVGDRYRVVWRDDSRVIRAGDFGANCVALQASWTTLVTDAAAPPTSGDLTPRIAYEPIGGRWALAYVSTANSAGVVRLYNSVASTTASATRTVGTAGVATTQALITWHAPTQTWLAGFRRAQPVNDLALFPLAANLDSLNVSAAGLSGTLAQSGLSCPMPTSQPVLELRFEELPGATTFADSSGRNTPATVVGAVAPTVGLLGARDAKGIAVGSPASDFALGFNGNALTANASATDDFSIAFWVNAKRDANSNSILFDQGANDANGWTVWMNGNGQINLLVGQNGLFAAPTRSDDGNWHFVVATRERASGQVVLYVDGAQANSGTFGTQVLTAFTNLRIGNDRSGVRNFVGQLDNVQLFRSVLLPDTVKAMYDRTLQSYCVAAQPNANGSAVNWAKLKLYQPDLRGGQIVASSGLSVTIDADSPTVDLTSINTNPYVRGNKTVPQIATIGGVANDATSGVASVEVRVNNGPPQTANGTNAWTLQLPVTEDAYVLNPAGLDRAGNRFNGAAMVLIADASPPILQMNRPANNRIVPARNSAGQWFVPISGQVNDPNILSSQAQTYPGVGVDAQTVQVRLVNLDAADVGLNGWQTATVNGNGWSINYLLPTTNGDNGPAGIYRVSARAADKLNNAIETQFVGGGLSLVLDAAAPLATLNQTDIARGLLTNTITASVSMGGVISEAGFAGISKLDVGFVPITQVLPLSSTIVHLPFDEASGAVYFVDTSGQINNAACQSTATCPTAGVVGQSERAVQFDGNDSLTVDRSVANDFSVSFWLKANAGDNPNSIIVDQGANKTNGWTVWMSNGQLGFLIGPAGLFLSLVRIDNGAWHHVLVTRHQATGTSVIYIDGAAVNTNTGFGSNALSAVSDIRIGNDRGDFVSPRPFKGAIDQFRLFSRALGAAEVRAVFEGANRTWRSATLSVSGNGTTPEGYQVLNWALPVPATLEGLYQIDLRGADALSNSVVTPNVWRGLIDVRAPQLKINAIATGQSYTDTAGVRRYEVLYTCVANDFQLDESKFVCPGNSTQEPVRSFTNDPVLKQSFPDLAPLSAISLTNQVWEPTLTPSQTMSACDAYNHCATATVSLALTPAALTAATGATAAPAAPVSSGSDVSMVDAVSAGAKAVIVEPARNVVVRASNGALLVTVAAESEQAIKDVTVLLDGTTAATLSFSQAKNKTRIVQSLTITPSAEGAHTLSTQVTDWSGRVSAQSRAIPFTYLTRAPQLAVGTSKFTISDTYQLGSGVLRLRGTVDTTNLASVQVRVADGPFAEASFGEGQWSIVLPVKDQDNRQLPITVVAIDRAGQRSSISNGITQDVSTANPPQTVIGSGPSGQAHSDAVAYDSNEFDQALALAARGVDGNDAINLREAAMAIEVNGADSGGAGNPNTATFAFAGTRGERDLAGFACALDEGDFALCRSPITYADLSKGAHTFKVRAIDVAGFVDPTPASFNWVVAAAQPDVMLKTGPANPSLSRSAVFGFVGDGMAKAFECALDGRAYAACATGQRYVGLSNGNHTFLVRAVDAAGKRGNAARYAWRVVNAAPLAQSQVVTTSDETPVAIKLSASDDEAVNYRIAAQPTHGSLQGTPPNLTYIPESDFFGVDEFSFIASDGQIDSAPAKVKITVQRGVYRFAALGQYGVALGQQAVITSGDIGAVGRADEDMDDKDSVGAQANGEGDFVEVYVAQQARMLNANNFALGDTVVIRQGAALFNVGYNRWFNQGTVQGEPRTPLSLSLLPSLPGMPSVTPGRRDVLVTPRSSLTLDPGSYGNVWVKAQGTLNLKPGVYHFKSVRVDAQAKLLMLGTTEMRVQGQLWVGQRATLGSASQSNPLSAKQIRIYVGAANPKRHGMQAEGLLTTNENTLAATSASEVEASGVGENLVPNQALDEGGVSAVVLGQGSQISANIVAPSGVIWVGQEATVVGALFGKWISVGQQAKLTLASAFGVGRDTAGVGGKSDPQGESGIDGTSPGLPLTVYLPFVVR